MNGSFYFSCWSHKFHLERIKHPDDYYLHHMYQKAG